ncbi:MAG: hypothetical protein HYT43_00300 [Candidatus Taylorbacteria bacterium]|nr:hypothetical protein [Candidatus Taylorbacteria bacterium]
MDIETQVMFQQAAGGTPLRMQFQRPVMFQRPVIERREFPKNTHYLSLRRWIDEKEEKSGK